MVNKKFLTYNEENPNVHVKIDFEQAIDSKKQVLISQIDSLKLIKGMNQYSQIRRRELQLREELKRESKELNQLIIEFKENMPSVQDEEKSKIRDDISAINRREIVESDLESIRQKLARLGGL